MSAGTAAAGKAAIAVSTVIPAAMMATMMATACASSAPPKPYYQTRTYQASAHAKPAIVECLIGKHVIPRSDVSASWFGNGRVASNAAFAGWLLEHGRNRYAGKTLDAWIGQAQRVWPSSYCGPSPAPAAPAGSQ